MTSYERVRVLGIRAQQLNKGAKAMIKINQNLSVMEIAKLELEAGMTPLKIKRPLPNNTYEIWKISELIHK
jgi:DNA-directed RNA polymerase subunit K/omega